LDLPGRKPKSTNNISEKNPIFLQIQEKLLARVRRKITSLEAKQQKSGPNRESFFLQSSSSLD